VEYYHHYYLSALSAHKESLLLVVVCLHGNVLHVWDNTNVAMRVRPSLPVASSPGVYRGMLL